MTSEVLMLNKDAVVIAADSAVTTGRDPHPRYSKAANKIFDLSLHGNVAVTIFAAAEVDRVPWELALKQFRKHDAANPQRPKLTDYVDALVTYLQANPNLFPAAILNDLLQKRFFVAAGVVLKRVGALFPDFIDDSKSVGVRAAAWANGVPGVAQELAALGYFAPLDASDHQAITAQQQLLEADLAPIVAAASEYCHANITQLATLAIEALLKSPTDCLPYTGMVFAGYGADEIFPSYIQINMYGHVSGKLTWEKVNSYTITHDNDAFIVPFAQSAMIDRFTDGFDSTLGQIINDESRSAFEAAISDLGAAGITIPQAVAESIVSNRQQEFMAKWKKGNWDVNFHPLRRVLNSLSVSEMGHLAESLLVLEELRERVTSPSESVGGPIDVAVITKAEGLLWLKRKHFFDAELNQRYLQRTNSNYT